MKTMMTVPEASELIQAGCKLFVAGDEKLLKTLPLGTWIGGTIPYFMTEEGGVHTRDRVQVTVLPDFVSCSSLKFYDVDELDRIPAGYTRNGFSYIVIPAFTNAHRRFAHDCSTWPGVFERPLLGWVAGVDLADLGCVTPKVCNGETGEMSESKAAVMHLDLPAERFARLNIVNLFRQGDGDIITFPKEGLCVEDCIVNGELRVFADYLREKKVDTRQPLVADYCGAMINVSFQKVDAESHRVALYAPVFPGVNYKIAAPLGNYEVEFNDRLSGDCTDPVFSCNCILNYLYADLEGKKTGALVGPITFGEIAYMLLNQTLVYLTFATK
jgi:hypothetical protein